MAGLSVEQFIELRKMAALDDDIRDCVDTIDALQRELAEAKATLVSSEASRTQLNAELDHWRDSLAPAPCGIKGHRRCDWVVGYTDKKFLDAKEGDPGYKDTVSMYYCLSCEREAAERKTAVQSRISKPQPTEVILGTVTVMVVGETREPAVTIHPSGVFVILPDTFKPGDRVEIVARLRET